ncbi:AAC(3)-I family aminoglycoside N-acetyltransferase [Tautonia sp. JC769]|uniref:AAC(3)-I family aminoglycoside N-acetyltransferase n=1 Tax=Tautonia sp. JC769 TaxID=3232135 RepID=UPI00345A1DD2
MTYRVLGPEDVGEMGAMLSVFGRAFGDPEGYDGARPSEGYLRGLLGSREFIAIAAVLEGVVVGGLAAYELRKFERERSEIYLYDLAVDEPYRRRGIATGLIDRLRGIAVERGAWVVFVQADRGDEPAIALYSKLGRREDVLHFDITPRREGMPGGTGSGGG